MELAHRLRKRRERLSLTQDWVATALDVSRPMLSYWESGARTPSFKQLRDLAALYGTSPGQLLGEADAPQQSEHVVLFRGLPLSEQMRPAVRTWLDFLDAWAAFRGEDLGLPAPGPGRPPRALGENGTITDRRRASVLADKVREHYELGQDALPDLYAFLDENGFLVYKANLGRLGRGDDSISGAFYNHPRLGYCILVNADTSPGRQSFTLAHELAHALYHHAKGGIICRFAPDDPLERFANSFAANLLVPGRELRRLAKKELERGRKDSLDPLDAISLATLFGVSYAMILVRLSSGRLITGAQYDEWRQFSANSLAEQLGLGSEEFRIPERKVLRLERYPMSVLEETKRAIEQGHLSPKQAAGLLRVDASDVQRVLLSPPPAATERERHEHEEFATA